MLEWRWLAANRKVRQYKAASIPNTAPVVHFTHSQSWSLLTLLGEQGHMCANNLPEVVTRQRLDREWNQQPSDHNSYALPSRHKNSAIYIKQAVVLD